MKSRLAVLSLLGFALAVAGPAHAPRLESAPGAIHCPGGRDLPPQGDSAGVSGSLGDMFQRHRQEEADQKRCLEDTENQDLLAGKFGEWAAFRAAWTQHRPYDYGRLFGHLLGGWTPRMILVGVIVLGFFARKLKR